MDQKIHINEIQLGSHLLSLFIKGQEPSIQYGGETYTHLWFLVDRFPELSQATNIKTFSRLSNFLWKGTQFEFIDCIPSYQKFYRERIELERLHPADVFEYRLTDYKIFDVSVMQEPAIEQGNLYYFVYQTSTGLPYKVVCPFPYTSVSSLVHYQILPIIEV
ncbi:MAG: hypothetical protein LW832_05765 [Parachlamydia sp.]|jgi:hypothetical protein|nr:hypothetical protein [Parachlamydia sp.]